MVLHQAVEEGFVGILNIAQVDVLIDFGFESLVLDPRAFGLFFDGFNHFRQQAQQVEVAALFHAEGAALVQERELQQNRTGVRNIEGAIFFGFVVHVTHLIFAYPSLALLFIIFAVVPIGGVRQVV